MTEHQYSCEKCHSTGYKTGEIRTTGSGLSRFLNLQNQKFTAISCDKCGYTDLFRTDGGGKIGNIFDVLTNQNVICRTLVKCDQGTNIHYPWVSGCNMLADAK